MKAMEALFTANFYDWYQVTFSERMDAECFISHAQEKWDFLDIERASPRVKQYTHAANLKRGDRVIMHLCWGGHNIGLHVISTGSVSHEVGEWMQQKFNGSYGVSRADVRMDTTTEGMFDWLVEQSSKFAIDRKVRINQQGDWISGVGGRTLYLGSKDSVVQVRIYEKGKKEGGDPNWVRIEIQVRPSKSSSKLAAAHYSPHGFWCSSRWSGDLMAKLFLMDGSLEFQTLGTVWRASDSERALIALVSQYGNTLDSLADSLPNGWGDVGDYLKHMRDIARESKKSMGGSGESPYKGAFTRLLVA